MSHTARVTARSAFRQVQDLMRNRCGVVIADDQDYLLDSRLMPVARQLGAFSVNEVVHRAVELGDDDARLAVIDAMTTHETFFFRDATFWSVFEQQVLSPLLKKRDVVDIWSGACSTGQEPYSIAMLVRERWPEDAHRVRIVATDVSPLSVQRARLGMFSTLEVNRGLGARRLARFFDTAPGGFAIHPEIAASIDWRAQNVVEDRPPGGPFDVILCRNVLIYFDRQDKERATTKLTNALKPEGFIGLGSSELMTAPSLAGGWYQPAPKDPR